MNTNTNMITAYSLPENGHSMPMIPIIIIANFKQIRIFLKKQEASFPENIFPIILPHMGCLQVIRITSDLHLKNADLNFATVICILPEGEKEPKSLRKKEVTRIDFNPSDINLDKILLDTRKSLTEKSK